MIIHKYLLQHKITGNYYRSRKDRKYRFDNMWTSDLSKATLFSETHHIRSAITHNQKKMPAKESLQIREVQVAVLDKREDIK